MTTFEKYSRSAANCAAPGSDKRRILFTRSRKMVAEASATRSIQIEAKSSSSSSLPKMPADADAAEPTSSPTTFTSASRRVGNDKRYSPEFVAFSCGYAENVGKSCAVCAAIFVQICSFSMFSSSRRTRCNKQSRTRRSHASLNCTAASAVLGNTECAEARMPDLSLFLLLFLENEDADVDSAYGSK